VSDIVEGDRQRREAIIMFAWEKHHRDGEVEIDLTDDEKDVSEGNDNGAYVRAWVWVDFSDTTLCKIKPDDPDSDMFCGPDCPHHGEEKDEG
jgi:hypothetical protein